MTGLIPYVHFPGIAREALTFYGEVFGCAVQLHTFAEFNRADGPADAIAHGYLMGDPSRYLAPTCPGTSPHSDPKASCWPFSVPPLRRHGRVERYGYGAGPQLWQGARQQP